LGRRTAFRIGAIVLLVALGGCSGDGDDGPRLVPTTSIPTSTTSVPPVIALTPAAPDARLEPTVDGVPEVLELRLGRVVNPTGRGFAVRVGLEIAGGAPAAYDLGEVSTFPTDAPGTFALRLPPAAVRDLTTGGATATVILHIQPVAADMPLPDSLRVVVTSATLRGA
jgi:hypothetical protein